MNTPVANNLLQPTLCPSSSCWTYNLSYSIPPAPTLEKPLENFPFGSRIASCKQTPTRIKLEVAKESAWKVQQNHWQCGRAASCEWHFKRLVRNRGCFKRTPDEDVVKRHAAAVTVYSSYILRRVSSWISSSGATVVNILFVHFIYRSLHPCATCILYHRNTCCARLNGYCAELPELSLGIE